MLIKLFFLRVVSFQWVIVPLPNGMLHMFFQMQFTQTPIWSSKKPSIALADPSWHVCCIFRSVAFCGRFMLEPWTTWVVPTSPTGARRGIPVPWICELDIRHSCHCSTFHRARRKTAMALPTKPEALDRQIRFCNASFVRQQYAFEMTATHEQFTWHHVGVHSEFDIINVFSVLFNQYSILCPQLPHFPMFPCKMAINPRYLPSQPPRWLTIPWGSSSLRWPTRGST